MKRKIFWSVMMSLCLSLAAGGAFAQDVALTSVGQSPDATMVKVVLKKLKINAAVDKQLDAAKLGSPKVLIAVVGGSSKGLGAAGVDKDQEKSRAVSLLSAANKKGVKVLVMHIGGSNRRGALSDSFVTAAVPYADCIIVVKGGNKDQIFDKNKKDKSIKIMEAPSIRKTQVPLEAVLAEWGVK